MTDLQILQIRLDELKNHGVEHCAGHSDAPGSCGTCVRINALEIKIANYDRVFCEAEKEGFICNRRNGHDGDHMDMHESGGRLGWRNR